MMASSFFDRIDDLSDAVGQGDLEGSVEFNQAYAQDQHETESYRHPRGGQAHYLSEPLFDSADDFMSTLASGAITESGSSLTEAMVENVEELADESEALAPVRYDNLDRSAHPVVTDQGDPVYDRPPEQRRLTEEEREAQKGNA